MAKTKTRTKTEAKPRKRNADDPEQYARFREFARKHETDEDPEAFDRAFRSAVKPIIAGGKRFGSKRPS
jgi:hypothetical protein